MLLAVNYHYIRESFDPARPGITGSTPSRFADQLDKLARLGEFVRSIDIADAILGKRQLPPVAIAITFDDGLLEQYENAWPILRTKEIPATFFVNTSPIADHKVSLVHKVHLLRSRLDPDDFEELMSSRARAAGIDLDIDAAALPEGYYRYDPPRTARLKYLLNFVLSEKDRQGLISAAFDELFPDEAEVAHSTYMHRSHLQELADAGAIGSHSHTHIALGSLDRPSVERDITESVRLLREWTGRAPLAISYPFGTKDASTWEVGEAAAASGILFGFTMERALNRTLAPPLHLARFAGNDVPGPNTTPEQDARFLEDCPSRTWNLAHD